MRVSRFIQTIVAVATTLCFATFLGAQTVANSRCVSTAPPCPAPQGTHSTDPPGNCGNVGNGVGLYDRACGYQNPIVISPNYWYYPSSWQACAATNSFPNESCAWVGTKVCREQRVCQDSNPAADLAVCTWQPIAGTTVLGWYCNISGGGGPAPGAPQSAAGTKFRNVVGTSGDVEVIR